MRDVRHHTSDRRLQATNAGFGAAFADLFNGLCRLLRIPNTLQSALPIFLLCLPAPGLQAQAAMLVSEGMSIRNDYGYEIIGRLRDRILLFRDKYDEFEIQAYDNQMHMAWSKELEDFDRRGVQILGVVGNKNDFSVIYKLRRRGATMLRIHKYDPGANLIDSMTVKNYGDRLFSTPVLDVVRSEDKNTFVVYNTAEHNKLELICFRADKMQVLWDKTVLFEDSDTDSNVKTMALSNTGEFFIVSEFNNRRSKMEEHQMRILRISAGVDQLAHVPLPEFLTHDVKFTYDNQRQTLVGAGLFADKNRDRSNGAFFLRLAPSADTMAHTLRYEPFDDKFISILRRKDVEDDTKGIADADVEQVVLRQDGGVLLIAERHHEVQRGTVSGRGFWRDGVRAVVDYYFDDLFVIAMHPDGNAHWKTVLHKKQYSQDDEATFSSFFLLRASDKMRFLFNDEVKYENTCSEYVINPIGHFDRNSLINTFNQNLRLRFRDALQISANECLVPSEFRNKLRLVLLRY